MEINELRQKIWNIMGRHIDLTIDLNYNPIGRKNHKVWDCTISIVDTQTHTAKAKYRYTNHSLSNIWGEFIKDITQDLHGI